MDIRDVILYLLLSTENLFEHGVWSNEYYCSLTHYIATEKVGEGHANVSTFHSIAGTFFGGRNKISMFVDNFDVGLRLELARRFDDTNSYQIKSKSQVGRTREGKQLTDPNPLIMPQSSPPNRKLNCEFLMLISVNEGHHRYRDPLGLSIEMKVAGASSAFRTR
jgi:hypothetical protein